MHRSQRGSSLLLLCLMFVLRIRASCVCGTVGLRRAGGRGLKWLEMLLAETGWLGGDYNVVCGHVGHDLSYALFGAAGCPLCWGEALVVPESHDCGECC